MSHDAGAAATKAHEDNQAKVSDQETQQSECQDKIPRIEFIAVLVSEDVAHRHKIALTVSYGLMEQKIHKIPSSLRLPAEDHTAMEQSRPQQAAESHENR